MAITLAKVNLDKRVHVKGNRWEVITDATLDSSYPTGGYGLTYKKLGIDYAPDFVQAIPTTTGHVFAYDFANQKLLAFSGGTEVSNATDLSTVVIRIVASGKGSPTL